MQLVMFGYILICVQLTSQETKLRSFHTCVAIAICAGKKTKTYGNAAVCSCKVTKILWHLKRRCI